MAQHILPSAVQAVTSVIPPAPSGLETPRLLLRGWQTSDCGDLCRLTGDPEMVRYIGDGRPWSASRTLDYLESQRAHLEARGYCHWKLVLRETGALVGLCGLNRCLDGDDDVGWWIARELWGRGLATEAARAALADAFGRLGLRRIVATTRSANVAAVRVMEKVGMRLLKRVPAEDLVLYELRHRRTWRRLWGHQFTAG